MNVITLDQRQDVYRKMAVATLRQVSSLMDRQTNRHLDMKIRDRAKTTRDGLEWLIEQIEKGEVPLERIEFLTWLPRPQTNLDHMTKK